MGPGTDSRLELNDQSGLSPQTHARHCARHSNPVGSVVLGLEALDKVLSISAFPAVCDRLDL